MGAVQHTLFPATFSLVEKGRLTPTRPLYKTPEIAMVGVTPRDQEAMGVSYVQGMAGHEGLIRAAVTQNDHRLAGLLFEPGGGHLTGMHIVGDQACELILIGQAVIGHCSGISNACSYRPGRRIAEAGRTSSTCGTG